MAEKPSERRLISECEAADLLSLSPKTLRRWRWSGTGPSFVKMGSAVRYRLADIHAFVDQSRRRSTTE